MQWRAPGFEDTELGVFMEPEVGHGETKVYAGVPARSCAADPGSRGLVQEPHAGSRTGGPWSTRCRRD
jgi:hypothetical protein